MKKTKILTLALAAAMICPVAQATTTTEKIWRGCEIVGGSVLCTVGTLGVIVGGAVALLARDSTNGDVKKHPVGGGIIGGIGLACCGAGASLVVNNKRGKDLTLGVVQVGTGVGLVGVGCAGVYSIVRFATPDVFRSEYDPVKTYSLSSNVQLASFWMIVTPGCFLGGGKLVQKGFKNIYQAVMPRKEHVLESTTEVKEEQPLAGELQGEH